MIPLPKERLIEFFKLAYAKNYSRGRKVAREDSMAIYFPTAGKYEKLFWRFYWKTEDTGYNDP